MVCVCQRDRVGDTSNVIPLPTSTMLILFDLKPTFLCVQTGDMSFAIIITKFMQ